MYKFLLILFFVISVNTNLLSEDNFEKGLRIAKESYESTRGHVDSESDQLMILVDPKGNEYYWMVGNMVDEDSTFDSDSYVVKNDYASLSPLGFNLSSSKEIEEMKKILD